MKNIIFSVFSVCFCLLIFTNLTAAQTPTPMPSPSASSTPKPLDPGDIILDSGGNRKTLLDSIAERNENEDTFLPIKQGETIEFRGLCSKCELFSDDPTAVAVIGINKLLGIKKNINVTITIKELIKEKTAATAAEYAEVKIKAISEGGRPFIARVFEESSDRITSETTLLSYRDVRDNFGKRIANTYVVVQLTISNQSANNQFYVQNIGISLDPGQCEKLDEYYKTITPYRLDLTNEERKSIRDVDRGKSIDEIDRRFNDCLKYYEENFKYPAPVSPIARDTVLAVGKAGEIRSKRRIAFSSIRFAADMGSVLTGLRLLGSDGVKAFNFLGTTVYNAADTAVPNVAASKYENLQKSLPEGPLIVNTRSIKTVNLFVPLDRIFSNTTFREYRYKVKKPDSDDSAFELKMMTELFLVSQVEGVLINDNAPRFTLKPGGGLNNVEKLKQPPFNR